MSAADFDFDYRTTRRPLETIPEAYQRTTRQLNELFDQCETPEQMTALVRDLGEKNEGMAARGMILIACNRMDRIFKNEEERIEMTNKIAAPLAAKGFRKSVEVLATALLTDWVGKDRAGEAVGRVSCALASSAACARNPQDFYDCTPQSVGSVIALAALTGIMPSTGRNSLAYAIPRRARQGEPPQLRYELSHRGVAALARRSGQSITAIPISFTDVIATDESGEVRIESRDIDNPPETMEQLRGVLIIVKEVSSGAVIGSGWIAKSVILKRRDISESWKYDIAQGYSYSPWSTYPIEQSMKTAMHYAVSRGWCVIDDTNSVRALESESVVVDGGVVTDNFVTMDAKAIEQQEEPETNGQEQVESESDQMTIEDAAHIRLNKCRSPDDVNDVTKDLLEQTDDEAERKAIARLAEVRNEELMAEIDRLQKGD